MPSFTVLLRKALPIGMLLVGWFGRATVDGKITLPELIDLAQALITELEINVTIELPPELAGTLSPGRTATLVGTVTGTVTASQAGEGR
jgi:hypothetical protein